MGLIRKMASVSTLGAVKYTSRREAETKLALEQAKAVRAERKGSGRHADPDAPAWRQPTVGGMLRKLRDPRQDGDSG